MNLATTRLQYGTFSHRFRSIYADLPIDAAILGSRSAKDLDVLVVGRAHAGSERELVDRFTAQLPVVLADEVDAIVKHEHRGWVTGEKPLVHVMLYPTMDHARTCEFPSLLACAFDQGEFLVGGRESFRSVATTYRSRGDVHLSISRQQMHRYADIALTTLIYATVRSRVYSDEIAAENLLYVLRFAAVEALVERLPAGHPIAFWEWPDLIDHLEREYPHYRWMTDLFRRREGLRLQGPELRQLLLAAYDITERGLTAAGANTPSERLAVLR